MTEDKMAALVVRLAEKTKAGSIHWESDSLNQNIYRFSLTFTTMEIAELENNYKFSIIDGNGREIESLLDTEFHQHVDYPQIHVMRDLYTFARRSSHDVDKQIDEIMSALK